MDVIHPRCAGIDCSKKDAKVANGRDRGQTTGIANGCPPLPAVPNTDRRIVMTTPRTPETVSAKPDPALAAQAATSRESTSAAMTKAALTSEALEDVDVRAREVEQQMTDDERFSLIVSLIGPVPSIGRSPRRAHSERGQEHERGLHARRAAARHPGAAELGCEHGRYQSRLPAA